MRLPFHLTTLCEVVPAVCRLVARPDIGTMLDEIMAGNQDHAATLDAIIRKVEGWPEGVQVDEAVMALLTICRQCSAEELLGVLHRCTITPTAEGLGMLVAEARRLEAQRIYALQLLWRLLGDEDIPDAMAVFDRTVSLRPAETIRDGIVQRLRKEEKHEQHA